MPTKRAILSELTRDELRSNLDYYGLDVRDRRVRSELVDALAGSRRARLDEMLGALARDRLKALCRAFDLDDAGRRKADLIGRLVGPVRAANTARGGATAAVAAATPAPAAKTADAPAEKLGVEQLERYLWSAADILRGSIDSSDYKTYIFGLLFLKRLSDRFEEEAEKLVAEGVSAEVAWTDPDEHQFFVPRRARLERHPEEGHEHRRGVEQGVRGPRRAESRAGRRPCRDRLQRRAQARRREEPRQRARAPRLALLAGLATKRPHGPNPTCSVAPTSTSSSSSPTTPARRAASSTRRAWSSSSSSSCSPPPSGCASATPPPARAACSSSAPTTSSGRAATPAT